LAAASADTDARPWQQACAATTTDTSATVPTSVLGLGGSLWTVASPWQATTTIDHETTGSGYVNAEARLDAPDVRVLPLTSTLSPTFAGAVKVGSFRATATASS